VIEVFRHSRQELPFLTRAMLWTSAALQGNWAAVAVLLFNLPLRSAVEDSARLVREGSSPHRALERHRLFAPIFIHLVVSGEASGRLGYMPEQAAKHQGLENERRIRLLTGIPEPAIIVAMGIVVLMVVLAILLPIIEMNQLVHR
jgi:general secretion pathway protein F